MFGQWIPIHHPQNRSLSECFHPSTCAYADDVSFAAASLRNIVLVIAPTFRPIEVITGMNLNHKKCFWVQHGTHTCEALSEWTAIYCFDFGGKRIAKSAKYIGTMIGLEGSLHRWTAPRNKFVHACRKIVGSPKSLVERWVEYKVYAPPVLAYVGSLAAPYVCTLTETSRALQRLPAGPFHATSTFMLMAH